MNEVPIANLLHLVITPAPGPLSVLGLRDLLGFSRRDARLVAYEVPTPLSDHGLVNRWSCTGDACRAEDERGCTRSLTFIPGDRTIKSGHAQSRPDQRRGNTSPYERARGTRAEG